MTNTIKKLELKKKNLNWVSNSCSIVFIFLNNKFIKLFLLKQPFALNICYKKYSSRLIKINQFIELKWIQNTKTIFSIPVLSYNVIFRLFPLYL